MADIQDINGEDVDMLSSDVSSHFKTQYTLKEFKSVGLDETFVLKIANSSNDRILAGLSNNSVIVYDGLNLSKIKNQDSKSPIIDVKFSPVNPDLYYTGTAESLTLWDLRTKAKVSEFAMKTEEKNRQVKPLTCFDINKDDVYLGAGTEVVHNDAFMLFWDVRKNGQFLGGYWETFGDDITMTSFRDSKEMVAASSDGQVNLFDISQENEDDALITSLNTEAPVRNVTFLPDNKMAIVLDHEEVLMWKTEDSEAFKTMTREDFTVAIKRKITPWTYVAGCHYDAKAEKTYFLAGSSCSSNPCLRILSLSSKNKLKPFSDLHSKSATNTLIRCTAMASDGTSFITGSEDGLICVWSRQGDESEKMESLHLKAKKKDKKDKKPYSK